MVTILTGDCRELLKTLPDASVNCCVTSPPYWGLRDYGVGGQIGLEKTPDDYVTGLVAVFREVWRVLRDDGTLWLNLGDSYASGKGTCHNPGGNTSSFNVHLKAANVHPLDRGNKSTLAANGLKPKDLVGIPWRVAFALQADGWYLRSEIIWHKPNPMPESVSDRPTKSHEQIFLMAKSAKYFYDAEAIQEPIADSTTNDARLYRPDYDVCRPERGFPGQASRGAGLLMPKSYKGSLPGRKDGPGQNRRGKGDRVHGNLPGRDDGGAACNQLGQLYRNKRSVWTVPPQPYQDAHFATFPPALITPCILAGCSAQVCAKCGAPQERIVKKSGGSIGHGSWTCHDEKDAQRGMVQNQTPAKSKTTDGTYRVETIGFGPTCSCDAGTVSGTVLDPFGGSGTVGEVAESHSRNSILIELNAKYVEMAKRRTAQQGLFCK